MKPLPKIIFLFLLAGLTGFAQQRTISEKKKLRYLKKIERKNDRYAKQQKKKTHKLLSSLSEKEKVFTIKLILRRRILLS